MKNLVLAAVMGGLVVLLGVKMFSPAPGAPTATAAPQKTSAFDRVVGTRTLRCAYATYDPFLVVGADKKLSGIFYDAVEEAGKRLGLKVEWTEEVGYANINTGFETNRYDAFCAGLWPAGTRAANTTFSRPIVWDPVGVWGRGDDTRFDGRMDALNDPGYKLAVIEGDATVAMADALFPATGRIVLSQNQSIGDEIANVTSKKADALFLDYLSADRFLKDTHGSLKNLSPEKPALIYALTVGFDAHETELKNMLDVVLGDMERDGAIRRIVRSHLGDKANLLFYQDSRFLAY